MDECGSMQVSTPICRGGCELTDTAQTLASRNSSEKVEILTFLSSISLASKTLIFKLMILVIRRV